MRSFWVILGVLVLLASTVFLFFFISVRVKDRIIFTEETNLEEPTVTIADPQLGPREAPVTLVNFGDYQCPACASLEQALQTLRQEFPQQLRIVWKDMPNTSSHDEALGAAVAAHCAGEQKKFWEYHLLLMENSVRLSTELYPQLATALELRENAFSRCLESQSTLPLVQRSFDEGVALDIAATPTLFINGERYTGSLSVTDLRYAIQAELADL